MGSGAYAAALLTVPSAVVAAPADVNAQLFYVDARAVENKGVMAVFDKRLKPMVEQMKDAGKRARAENEAAGQRGQPLYCVPPAERKKGMSSQQALAMLGQISQAERERMTLAQAWRQALIRRYPCR